MAYIVIYRTGGTLNFKWHQTTPVSSYAEAAQRSAEIERMGYPTRIHEAQRLASIGMPETFT